MALSKDQEAFLVAFADDQIATQSTEAARIAQVEADRVKQIQKDEAKQTIIAKSEADLAVALAAVDAQP